MPDARVEVKWTASAASGWLFLICQVIVSVAVTAGPPFCAEPITWTSVVWFSGMNAVVTLALLLAKFGSPLDCTDAWFTVCALGLTVTVMVTLAPLATTPRLQLIVIPPTVVQVPCVVVTEETVAPETLSSIVTAGALPGPRLVTTTVYATFAPAMTEA